MVGKNVIKGVLLGALLVLFCAVGIRKGAVNMVFLYHADVQDRCVQNGLITRERICFIPSWPTRGPCASGSWPG